MKFRKKPVLVDAVQLTKEAIDSHVLDKAPLPKGCYLSHASSHAPTRTVYRAVVRLKNTSLDIVMPGDWIICDADGSYSTVKPNIFEATYEPVPPSALPWVDSYRKVTP